MSRKMLKRRGKQLRVLRSQFNKEKVNFNCKNYGPILCKVLSCFILEMFQPSSSFATQNSISEVNSQNLDDSFNDKSEDEVASDGFVDQQIRKKTTANIIKGNHNLIRNSTYIYL